MQKLALYFLSQGESVRILDATQQPLHGSVHGWTLGRFTTCDIVFSIARNPDYGMVSKRHALILSTPREDTTEGGTKQWEWTVTDCGDKGKGSTNGTYLSHNNGYPYRLQPGIPYRIQEGDRIQFGCKAAAAKLSFDIDDTKSGDHDDDPPTGSGLKPLPAAAPAAHSPWFVPAILEPVWVWFTAKGSTEQFVFLLAIGGFAALILYIWKL